MAHDTKHLEEHLRACLVVFGCLLVLTGVTVWVSYWEFPTSGSIAVALSIAGIKGTLVTCYFMHLISEKKLIFFVLLLTSVFFFAALLLPVFTHNDVIKMLVNRGY